MTLGLLIVVLVAAAALRFTGRDWDQGQHLHPDERFLTMVAASLRPVEGLGDYFDTARSTLNPKNVGDRPDYVYGTFPVVLARLTAGVTGGAGYSEVHLVGRALSAGCDVLVVLLVFLLGNTVGDRRVGLLAAAFASVSVLQIQQSHFFTVDNFANLFSTLALLASIRLAPPDGGVRGRPLAWSLLFGVAAGAAVAAKVNTAPIVLLLPVAATVHLGGLSEASRGPARRRALLWLGSAGVVFLLTFRVLQPYAFTGPGLLGVAPNPQWVQALKALAAQAGANSDWPPAMQWARRSVLFSGTNLVLWGLGPPLGLLAWSGFLWAGYRLLVRLTLRHAVLWLWVGGYFAWQSLAHNPTMRYQLPIYPPLAALAAWAVVELGRRRPRLAVSVGVAVLALTAAWAAAFTGIYTRPVTRVAASEWILRTVPGPVNLEVEGPSGRDRQILPVPHTAVITPERPWTTPFSASADGTVGEVLLARPLATGPGSGRPVTVTLAVAAGKGTQPAARGTAVVGAEGPGEAASIPLDPPLRLRRGEAYRMEVTIDGGALRLHGSGIVNESSWDDGLPLRVLGYDPYGGIYAPDLNLELYVEETEAKRERMAEILDRADLVAVSSSRQWGSLPRLPERYPLATAYYRALLGCPGDRTVEACYTVAQPGMFTGELGFELVRVFESRPRIGPFSVNDQWAEEAFTVYDHPKVLLFAKTPSYRAERVRSILGAVDLSRVVHLVPGRAGRQPADLMLPPERLAEQRAGGTWRELFGRDRLINRWQPLTVLVWYLAITLLGVITLPFLRLALPGLADHGWGLARVVGLLLPAYLVWLAGSAGVPATRTTISAAVLLLAGAAAVLAVRGRERLVTACRERWRVLATVEVLFLVLFLAGLAVRIGNPDLWHPAKGGEKPMDFSYFNAILKSTTYPPYDPWFAGGYLNYYYWGFVMVGVPVKWLGIVPAVAYNLALPTLLALVGCAAFTVAWNLVAAAGRGSPGGRASPTLAGVAAALATAVVGNLATFGMVVTGLVRLGDAEPGAGVLARAGAFLVGVTRALGGATLPFDRGEWYWNPTRIIPDPQVMPITEFPSFTFLYADLHAHFLDLPVTLLVLAWALSVTLRTERWAGRRHPAELAAAATLGAVAVGSLRGINTWSFYPYLLLAGLAVAVATWRVGGRLRPAPRLTLVGIVVSALVGLAHLSFAPFAVWFGQAYTRLDPWMGTRTPLSTFLVHWGLPLFVLLSWLAWEARCWLAATPVSTIGRLRPHRHLIAGGFLAWALLFAALLGWGVACALVVWPALGLTAVLLMRPDRDWSRRVVLVLLGTALGLTLAVELVVLRGDMGRMNTVFKFYLQAWTLLGVASGAAVAFMVAALREWRTRALRVAWRAGLTLLAGAATMFPIVAGTAKVLDRMAPTAPPGLDGMAYMEHAVYFDRDTRLDLVEDSSAIRWLQERVAGSPVIVEANTPEYRWGSRCSIYTGLPGVVGWNWHQRQQRALVPDHWVWERVRAVERFYTTTEVEEARDILRRHAVRYVVLGQLERAYYGGPGLEKFDDLDGVLWRSVHREGRTAIYEVLAPP